MQCKSTTLGDNLATLKEKKKGDFLDIMKTFHFNIVHNTFTMKLHFTQPFSQKDTVLCV